MASAVDRRVFDPDKKASVRVLDDSAATARRLVESRITAFTGEYDFLSTLSKSRVVLPGEGVMEGEGFQAYPTVEHALQASKSSDPTYRQSILSSKDALEAKRRGAKAPNVDKQAWKLKSLVVMEALLRDKFRRHKGLRQQLMNTGTKQLVYENEHNDQFWGTCKGKGHNHLGQLLERVRADEKEGLLGILLWAKQVFNATSDSKVRLDVSVTREGHPLPEADLTLERKAIVTFGKLAENDVPVAHPSTSRFHAMVVVSQPYGPLLVDLEAANGSFLDERRLEPFKGAALHSGVSEVALGTSSRRYTFTFDLAAAAKRSLALYEVLEDPLKLAAARPELGVFMNNLPKDVTEEMVRDFVADCGTVLSVAVPRHRTSQEPRGFAIVMFGTEAAVVSALKLDRDLMGGSEVRVRRRKKDEEHGPSGGVGPREARVGKTGSRSQASERGSPRNASLAMSSDPLSSTDSPSMTDAAATASARLQQRARESKSGEDERRRGREGGGRRHSRSGSSSAERRERRRGGREEEVDGRCGRDRAGWREVRSASRSRERVRGRERERSHRHRAEHRDRHYGSPRKERGRDRSSDRVWEPSRSGRGERGSDRSRSRERPRRGARKSPTPPRRRAERRSSS